VSSIGVVVAPAAYRESSSRDVESARIFAPATRTARKARGTPEARPAIAVAIARTAVG
jgi:hypothetical protein